MTCIKNTCTILFLILTAAKVSAQGNESFEKKTFTRGGQTLLYRILYPENYNRSKKYPVLTFLHGSGERGSDNEAQLKHGGQLFLKDSVRTFFKAIVIFPQCPPDSTWSYFTSTRDTTSPTGRFIDLTFNANATTPARLVKGLLDSLLDAKVADPKRMYIGGLSLGGFGTFDMIERYPGFFAAAVPICGGGDTTIANRFSRNVAVWLFHGDSDKSVDVKNSRTYYAVLKKSGANVRYTEYPGVGHNSWDNAFNEKKLLTWMLSKRRK